MQHGDCRCSKKGRPGVVAVARDGKRSIHYRASLHHARVPRKECQPTLTGDVKCGFDGALGAHIQALSRTRKGFRKPIGVESIVAHQGDGKLAAVKASVLVGGYAIVNNNGRGGCQPWLFQP